MLCQYITISITNGENIVVLVITIKYLFIIYTNYIPDYHNGAFKVGLQ